MWVDAPALVLAAARVVMRGPARSAMLIALCTSLASGCPCTEIGYGPSFHWSAALPTTATFAEIQRLYARTCRNGDCRVARLDAIPDLGTGIGIPLRASVGAAAGAGATAWLFRSVDETYRLSIDWTVADAADGDRYLVEVVDPRGAVVIGLAEETVVYTRSHPNGPDCGPECRSAARGDSTR